jgi:adenylate kinase family enzyme
MQKIMVIGCCGAGKSTFSKRLQEITNLELIHLDQHYWKPNWEETDKNEWQKVVQQLADKPNWIIDGNYTGTLDIRIEKADTIIYFDFPTWKCLWRVILRVFKYWGKQRPDMPKGCNERFDFEFLHYVAIFNILKRKRILEKLEIVKNKKVVKIFKTDLDATQYLDRLKQL